MATVLRIFNGTGIVEKNFGNLKLDNESHSQYPREWFTSNPDKKPKLMVPLREAGSYKDLLDKMGDIWQNQLDLDTGLDFLYEFISKECKVKLTKDWSSYGRSIGKEGDTVDPFCMVEVTREKYNMPKKSGPPLKEQDSWGRALEILGTYRTEQAGNAHEDYKTSIVERIKQVAKKDPFKAVNFDTNNLSGTCQWGSDQRLRTMVACIDMFFNKFRNHKYSSLRVATLPSRDMGCGGLNALQDLSEYLSKPINIAVTFLVDRQIRKELDRLLQEFEEFTNQDSYFHYMRDLGLTPKSPYSSKENPKTYNLVYSIGVFLGHKRAINATLFNEFGMHNTVNIAAYVAYCAIIVGTREGVTDMHETGKNLVDGKIPRDLSKLTAAGVLEKITENKNQMTDDIRKFFKPILDSMSVRKNTIGAFIKSNF